ncbi:MAG: YdjY domain-containing protein [Planctomycetia bacterium]
MQQPFPALFRSLLRGRSAAGTAAACLSVLVAALVTWEAVWVAAGAEPDAKPAAVDRHPELKRLSPKDDVWIDAKEKRVVVGGTIAVDKGAIEFFACPHGTKEHESIVATRSTAQLVHAGLLAIGLVPGRPVSFDPEYRAASGPVVRVTMRWKDEAGRVQEVPAQRWIRDTRSGEAMREQWVFAGSVFWKDPADGKDYYQADGGDLICLSNFPTAMLDLPIESSQSNEALLFEAFAGRVPPRGTDVEMILSAAE